MPYCVGTTIRQIREATKDEARKLGIETSKRDPLVVIVLSSGTLITASRDEEGNGPGTFMTLEPDGLSHIIALV